MTVPIHLLYGGTSAEREVSLRSGAGVADALRKEKFSVTLWDLKEDALPAGLDPDSGVVFPILHGTFGEDGQLQSLLEQGGFEFAGCGSRSSALCFDKEATLLQVEIDQVPTAERVVWNLPQEMPSESDLLKPAYPTILKPACQGSSVGLQRVNTAGELKKALQAVEPGKWLLEEFVEGREFSVGVLDGSAQGVVEIRPKGGIYDFEHKYTVGATDYLFPAPLEENETLALQKLAELVYGCCDCRDFGRVDFLMRPDGRPVFLEINTLPGMTATSLLPKSAQVMGLDYSALVARMVGPAIARWKERSPSG